jgi:t-SNARE complex subunit (syntaxin)
MLMANRTSLDVALKKVEEERLAGQSIDQKMAELRAGAPDIAEMVDDERLTLEAGITELRTRQLRIEEGIDAAKRAIARIADIPVQGRMASPPAENWATERRIMPIPRP